MDIGNFLFCLKKNIRFDHIEEKDNSIEWIILAKKNKLYKGMPWLNPEELNRIDKFGVYCQYEEKEMSISFYILYLDGQKTQTRISVNNADNLIYLIDKQDNKKVLKDLTALEEISKGNILVKDWIKAFIQYHGYNEESFIFKQLESENNNVYRFFLNGEINLLDFFNYDSIQDYVTNKFDDKEVIGLYNWNLRGLAHAFLFSKAYHLVTKDNWDALADTNYSRIVKNIWFDREDYVNTFLSEIIWSNFSHCKATFDYATYVDRKNIRIYNYVCMKEALGQDIIISFSSEENFQKEYRKTLSSYRLAQGCDDNQLVSKSSWFNSLIEKLHDEYKVLRTSEELANNTPVADKWKELVSPAKEDLILICSYKDATVIFERNYYHSFVINSIWDENQILVNEKSKLWEEVRKTIFNINTGNQHSKTHLFDEFCFQFQVRTYLAFLDKLGIFGWVANDPSSPWLSEAF